MRILYPNDDMVTDDLVAIGGYAACFACTHSVSHSADAAFLDLLQKSVDPHRGSTPPQAYSVSEALYVVQDHRKRREFGMVVATTLKVEVLTEFWTTVPLMPDRLALLESSIEHVARSEEAAEGPWVPLSVSVSVSVSISSTSPKLRQRWLRTRTGRCACARAPIAWS